MPLAGSALFHVYFIRKKVIHIEVKIPKEIRAHRETIFFGLSARQFICAVLAVGLAAGIYLGLGGIIGKETASWLRAGLPLFAANSGPGKISDEFCNKN